MNHLTVNLFIATFIIFTYLSCAKRRTYIAPKEEFCCVWVLKDSTKSWCEKIELMDNCKITISPCWNALVKEMHKKTKIYTTIETTTFGLIYPNLNQDLKKWKKALGCKQE